MFLKSMIFTTACLTPLATMGVAAADPTLAGTTWHVTLDTHRFGPVETVIAFEEQDGQFTGTSQNGSLEVLRTLPGAADAELDTGLFVVRLEKTDAGYVGPITAPWSDGEATIHLKDNQLEGGIRGGAFTGSLAGTLVDAPQDRLRDYPALWKNARAVIADKVYDPEALSVPAYAAFSDHMTTIANSARDDLDLILGFQLAWQNDPFSHFELKRSHQDVATMIEGFDRLRMGGQGAGLELEGDTAILTVHTMMGLDTIELIEQAYQTLTEQNAKALIIDLRGNGGGAFAIVPLVQHVIDRPLDAGYFIANRWHAQHDRLPTPEEVDAIEPWTGYSIKAFWNSVQTEGLMKLRFQPAEPNFDGPVFVVTDHHSASATELAVDALKASGAVTVVGEKTVGHMLSQSFFDVADGFVIVLPVADYYSSAHGRIEGAGVEPHIESPSDDALSRAKQLAREAIDNR